ncbi:MAG: sulfatase family protein [Thermomicrobiales bacterium]
MDQPNVLFFLPDQHRADYLGANPALPLRTPHLDALAAQGMRYTNAITPSPLCAPARACLASGRGYERCGVPGNAHDYPLDQPTYYALLRAASYHVAGVGKFDLHKKTLDWGLDGARLLPEWGFSAGIDNEGKIDAIRSGADEPRGPYMAELHRRGLAARHVHDFQQRHPFRDTYPTPLPDDAYCDNWIAENGLGLMRQFPTDQPWHLVVNFTGPHNPMDVTEAMQRRWEGVAFPPPHNNTQWDAETHQQIRRNYAAMIENIDRHAGRFIAAIRDRGELDRTLIIYSSDHGEMLGDHDRWGKSIWRQPSVGIPLIVSGPGVARGATSDALVSFHDLAATLLDYAGLDVPAAMDSRSLRAVLEGRHAHHRDAVVSGLGDWRMVYDGRFKLVRGAGIKPMLFDLLKDPHEDDDVAAGLPAEAARLGDLLAQEAEEVVS